MSEENKELLARIGQLAGQINRHKSQQSTTSPKIHYSRHTHGHSTVLYSPRGKYRGGRLPAVHRNRSLQLNKPSTPTESDDATSGPLDANNWVSKTDRHRQLINANVYEQQVQNRSRAIEESRRRKVKQRELREKMRLKAFLQSHGTCAVSTGPDVAQSRNEVLIDGMRFRVMDGGKKLSKVMDDLQSTPATPKIVNIAGVEFHRTKTGNLVAHRVVQAHRRTGTMKKMNKACKMFSTTGSCPKGPLCRYQHDPNKVAVCKEFVKEGRCAKGDGCDLSHELRAERMPDCLHFGKGFCAKADCVYTHSKAAAGAPVCEAFGLLGYCEKGGECGERHVYECPEFSNTGRCRTKGCKLAHRERASVLRAHAKADEAMEDLSSDEEAVDSDDVDSDEVAEFIDADSDGSDSEGVEAFLPV
ncbi:hypothetical protein CDD81_3944 [Ophiocordyceps australis]|uniref:C3H1-type domain-containing protein n=1 Tax=Ophiocordyceps australis TaxID=1399860 RepID=A0A2C5XDW4_9HYPO|nr:hypothetical protein CDD81_3944 [Ophiocordyceps australis]